MKWLVVITLVLSAPLQAWDCKYSRTIEDTLDVTGSEMIDIAAVAGELNIVGESGRTDITIRGKVCVSDEDWLDEVSINTTAGKTPRIAVKVPEAGGWSFSGNQYASVDLELVVPADIALNVQDSSGDLEIENVASVTLKDSSGDIEIQDVNGSVEIKDSSGSIQVRDIAGDLVIPSDSSGSIRGSDIKGSVLVENDSSGDMRFSHIGQNVTVENDSSGDIEVNAVAGDFTVMRDGSGSIESSDVEGEVDIPKHKRS